MRRARVACLLAGLLVTAANIQIDGQSPPSALFLAIVRLDGVLVPIATYNGAEWWGGWPSNWEENKQLRLPSGVSSTPTAWLPPGLSLPTSWTLFDNAGRTREVQVGGFTRPDSIMDMIGLTTNYQRPRLKPGEWAGPTEEEAGIAVAGEAEIGGVEELDITSADWQLIWPRVQAGVNIAESAAIPRWETEMRQGVGGFSHPASVLERAKAAPNMVHLARMLRPTEQGTWYHFVAHKRYGVAECAPVTDITGIVVRDAAGGFTVKHLDAFATDSCGSNPEPSILASLHWAGPVLWVARQNYEDGFAYFLYDAEAHAQVELRGVSGSEEPMRAISMPLFDDAAECNFGEFRREFSQAVTSRDWIAIQRAIEPGIQVTQSDGGLDAFNSHWRPGAPDSPLWSALDSMLRLGGACDRRDTFVAPYITSVWPWLPGRDSLRAVVASGVPLRQLPRADAAVLSTLDYAMVRPIAGAAPQGDWIAVDAGAGRRGYVEARYLRSRTPSATFSLAEGKWRLSALYAPEP